MNPSELRGLCQLFAFAFAGGLAAWAMGLPLPFMLGALAVTAVSSIATAARGKRPITYPEGLRKTFIAVIGTMIGGTFTPELTLFIPSLWISLLAMVPFLILAQTIGYAIYRHVGGYGRVTSLFAAMPGGLVEAVELGHEAGGDVAILGLQHFARIVLVVVMVPQLIWALTGDAVGSASGQAFSHGAWSGADVILVLLVATAGLFAGKRMRLPAAHMTGPLLLSAVLHVTGVLNVESPAWLLALAQLVVGAGLGARFSGTTRSQLLRSFGLGLLGVTAVLATGFAFASVLTRLTPFSREALLISFAPGGVTEMGLIALSMSTSPVTVATHHLFRIVLTVSFAGFALRSGLVRRFHERR